MQIKIVAGIMVCAALAACQKQETAVEGKATERPQSSNGGSANPIVVKIGHVAPTSGPLAHLGRDNQFGAQMAIDELNLAKVRIGGEVARFELVAEDDAADPKQGTAAAQKLVDEKVNGVIGHLNSGTSIPASKIYSDAGIPQISPSATNPKYTRQGFATTFRVVADDVRLGSTLGKYATETLKAKRIAVIDDRTAYGQGVAAEFEKTATESGGSIVGHEFTTDKATDFSGILTKIKALEPDVLFFGGMDAVAGPMLKQLKQLGLKVKFMGGDGICSGELPKLAGDAVGEDMVVCAEAGGVPAELKQPLETWKANFKQRNGVDVQMYAPYVYDAVKVMAAAMVKAGSADPVKYLPALKAIEYRGLVGPISFDEKGDLRDGAMTLHTFRHGARVELAVVH